MSGSIKANGGTNGGMTIDDDSIFAGTKDTAGFASNNADITIAVQTNDTKVPFSIVKTEGLEIKSIVEKQVLSNYINKIYVKRKLC